MQMPVIHMNGTSRDRMVEQYCAARQAVLDAIEALAKIDVNGRDYYPLGPDAITIARSEHYDRMEALSNVASDLMKIAEHCDGAP